MMVDVIYGMDEEEYFAMDALSSSDLKAMRNGELACWTRRNTVQEEKDHLQFGKAVHASLLEDKTIYVVAPYKYDCIDTKDHAFLALEHTESKAKKSWSKERLLEQCRIWVDKPIYEDEIERLEASGNIVLSQDSVEQLERMVEAAKKQYHDTFNGITDTEVTILWADDATGLKCKARLDAIGINAQTGRHFILDAKTIDCGLRGVLPSVAYQTKYYGYGIQSRWYSDAYYKAFTSYPEFNFLFMDKSLAFPRLVMRSMDVEAAYWEAAGMLIDARKHKYAHCKDHFGDSPWIEQYETRAFTDEELNYGQGF